jgi:membrane-bound serine protease (ClpP class)
VVISITVFFALVIRAVTRAHRRQVTTGKEGLMGKVAVAKTELDPVGTIFVEGERWTATAEDGKVEPGEEVIITRVEKLSLRVRKNKPL